MWHCLITYHPVMSQNTLMWHHPITDYPPSLTISDTTYSQYHFSSALSMHAVSLSRSHHSTWRTWQPCDRGPPKGRGTERWMCLLLRQASLGRRRLAEGNHGGQRLGLACPQRQEREGERYKHTCGCYRCAIVLVVYEWLIRVLARALFWPRYCHPVVTITGKKKAGPKFPGLADLSVLTDTPRQRLEKKLLSKQSLRRVADNVDKLATKKFNDKFGNNFNYALKNWKPLYF